MITPSIRDNVAALRQGVELLAGLSAEAYARRTAVCFNSSAGGHLRHVIEHYLSFLQGAERGEIDYEARARDAMIESDPKYAAAQMEAISERLEELSEDRLLAVRVESAADEQWSQSTLVRELEFLLSHTIHHYALIGVICQLGGHGLPKDFGMAPSTLRYLQAQAASSSCAR